MRPDLLEIKPPSSYFLTRKTVRSFPLTSVDIGIPFYGSHRLDLVHLSYPTKTPRWCRGGEEEIAEDPIGERRGHPTRGYNIEDRHHIFLLVRTTCPSRCGGLGKTLRDDEWRSTPDSGVELGCREVNCKVIIRVHHAVNVKPFQPRPTYISPRSPPSIHFDSSSHFHSIHSHTQPSQWPEA